MEVYDDGFGGYRRCEMVVLAVTGCISILSIVAFLLLVKSGGGGGNAKALPLREQGQIFAQKLVKRL